ncbi:MAG: alpha/beta fold hydrolase [Solirubrobacterales bacterium]
MSKPLGGHPAGVARLVSAALEPRAFTVERDGAGLSGEAVGEGPVIVLAHGLTASRRYVVHGSRVLPRQGFRAVSYDARGHGESDPAPGGRGYGYGELAGDLGAVIDQLGGGRRCVLVGHSMGAHTLIAHALGAADRVAAVVPIGPTFLGAAASEETLAYWDRLADGLEQGGVEGFVAAYDRDLEPRWRETLLRITRDRLAVHRHPEAVAQALREVPRSRPFEDLAELEFLELPALVVASHDQADPGHPYAVAEAWADRMPRASVVSERPGASPLAWQGGRLSREIAAFCERPDVAERLAA